MRRYFGIAEITVDGDLLESLPGAKLDTGGITRTPVRGDGKIGFAEARKEAMVECEISLGAQTDVAKLNNASDVTVVFKTDVGQSWILREAFLTEPLVITGGEGGKIPVKLAADSAEKA
jgi:hypothetical protein